MYFFFFFFFFSSRRRHTRLQGDWSSDVCSSDLCKRFAGRSPPASLTYAETAKPRIVDSYLRNNKLTIHDNAGTLAGRGWCGGCDLCDLSGLATCSRSRSRAGLLAGSAGVALTSTLGYGGVLLGRPRSASRPVNSAWWGLCDQCGAGRARRRGGSELRGDVVIVP